MDRKNERFDAADDSLKDRDESLHSEEEAVSADEDAKFESLLRAAVGRYAREKGEMYAKERELVLEDREEEESARRIRKQLSRRKEGFGRFGRVRRLEALGYAAVLVILCCSVMMLAVGAFGWNTTVPWSKGVTREDGVLSIAIPLEKWRDPPDTISGYLAPSLFPLGCQIEVEQATEVYFSLTVRNAEGEKLAYFTQSVINEGSGFSFSDDGAEVIDVTVKDNTALLLKWSEKDTTLLWQDGFYVYAIHGFLLSQEEILAMGESLTPYESDLQTRKGLFAPFLV